MRETKHVHKGKKMIPMIKKKSVEEDIVTKVIADVAYNSIRNFSLPDNCIEPVIRGRSNALIKAKGMYVKEAISNRAEGGSRCKK